VNEKEAEMKMSQRSKWMTIARLSLISILAAAALVVFQAAPAAADDKQDSMQLVDRARLTFESFMSDSNMGAFRGLMKKAHGVLIAPQVLKGAFVVGASGGSGVLLVRDEKTGRWSEPAFYTIGEASLGLQIGVQEAEIILLAMTQRGVTSFLGSSFKLGADVGVAAGPVGIGTAAATANLSADILSFSRAKGLYGGASVDGAVVAPRSGLNEAYYGKKVSPLDILDRHDVTNRHAHGLVGEVEKGAAAK
jgi:lipid-binding SYLF domain-containing protein